MIIPTLSISYLCPEKIQVRLLPPIFIRTNTQNQCRAVNLIVSLELEHADAWVSVYEDFFVSYPWSALMGEKQIQDLLTRTENTESWVGFADGQVVVIGTLRVDNDQSTGIVQNFAYRSRHEPAALEMLKHLASRTRTKNLDTVALWTWEGMVPILNLMSQTGFHITEQMSLMHANPADIIALKDRPIFTIKSLADGLPICDFVEANQLAFVEDRSRPLERDELKCWIESLPGYRTDLQLAAFDNDRIIGTVMSEYEEVQCRNSKFRRAWVYGLGVVPNARRRGVATCLMTELSQRLHIYGVRDIWLLTDLDGSVRKFYEAVGFHRHTIWIEFEASSKLL
jgi:GNAT superfamily N-acetyltransferase